MTKVLVIAKAPTAGRVKTRLCPPCTYEEAARIAAAALEDTLAAVACVPDVEPVLVLDGDPGPWVPSAFNVIAQRGVTLAERLEAAFEDAGGSALLVGMDTPQVTTELLVEVVDVLHWSGTDAVLGAAHDGGWWAAGFTRPVPCAFVGIPMSTPYTAQAQRNRFRALGLRVAELPRLQDVDQFDDAVEVARQIPRTRFASAVAEIVARHVDCDGGAIEEAIA